MMNLLIMNTLFIFILIIMLMINLLISKKMFKNREKMSPFECGFDNLTNNRLPFSLQFYMISIIFLIFDVEIALVLPMIKFMNFNYLYLIMNSIFILLILIIGLLIEWKEGALNWFK